MNIVPALNLITKRLHKEISNHLFSDLIGWAIWDKQSSKTYIA